MKRKALVIKQKTKIAHRLPAESEENITKFQRMIIQMRKRNSYELQQIGNMGETPVTRGKKFLVNNYLDVGMQL